MSRRAGSPAVAASGREAEGRILTEALDLERRAIELLGPVGSASFRTLQSRRRGGLEVRGILLSAVEDGRSAGEDASEVLALLSEVDRLRWSVVRRNQKFVMMLLPQFVARFRGSIHDEGDIAQEMLEGAFEAAKRFDPSMGLSFRTYAAWWIRARASSLDDSLLSSPRGARELRFIVSRQVAYFKSRNGGRGPSIAELSELTGENKEMLLALGRLETRPLPLDADEDGDEEGEGRYIGDPAAPTEADLAVRIDGSRAMAVVMELPEDERQVLSLALGPEEMSLTGIAEADGRSRERIRVIRNRALSMVAHAFLGRTLAPFGSRRRGVVRAGWGRR